MNHNRSAAMASAQLQLQEHQKKKKKSHDDCEFVSADNPEIISSSSSSIVINGIYLDNGQWLGFQHRHCRTFGAEMDYID